MGESEPSFAFEKQLSSFMNENPIWWGVYGFVIMLPVVFIIAYFWPKKKIDSSAQRKKTDAPSPDDDALSRETRKERSSSWREQRNGQSVVTRQEQESLSRRGDLNSRTVTEREVINNEAGQTRTEREREVPDAEVNNEAAIVSNGTVDDITTATTTTSNTKPPINTKEIAESAPVHNGGIVENGYHDDEPVFENGVETEDDVGEGIAETKRWSFPPVLDDFNLMESDVDPTELERIFADERLKEIELHIKPDSPGLGISIVGGSGSPSGDLPILIKRVLPKSLAEQDGRLKQGDELVAVNDTLLVGMSKDFAINVLSNMHGDARLLVLQDD